MGRNKREQLEFHFYEIPQGESVRTLMGDRWQRVYGHKCKNMHFHNLMQIGICHQGSGVFTLDNRDYPYTSGAVVIIPANCPHYIYSEQEAFWEFMLISSTKMLLELFPNSKKVHEEKLAMVNQRAIFLNSENSSELATIVREILCEMKQQDDYHRDVVHDLVKILMLRLLRINEEGIAESPMETISSPQIQPALSYIHENFSHEIRADELAKQCGLSEPHFRRVFREHVDMTPIDYLNFVRIREACKMINQSDCPMDIVAAECGFSSVSTFTRNFKKFLNITPYQWKLQTEKHSSRLRDYSITLLKNWGKK